MSHEDEKDNARMGDSSMTDIVRDKLEDTPETKAVSPKEKALLRKLDARILPIACLMYLFACAFAIRSQLLRAGAGSFQICHLIYSSRSK
jgi:hypothetical protein